MFLFFAKVAVVYFLIYIVFFTNHLEKLDKKIDSSALNETAQVLEPIESTEVQPVQVTPVTPVVAKKKVQPPCERLIKGDMNDTGDKIFHLPGGDFYDITVAEETFCTKAEAVASGYRKSDR